MKFAPLDEGATTILAALDQRLEQVARVLLPGQSGGHAGALPVGTYAATVLPDLVAATGPTRGPRHWLLLTAVAGAFPLATDVERLARRVELDDPDEVAFALLDWLHAQGGELGPDLPMEIVCNRVVVDVDFCANNDKHSGIQRVTRHLAPRWDAAHDICLVSQTATWSGYRNLDPRGEERVLRFGESRVTDADSENFVPRLVVPWQTTVLWPEVPNMKALRRLAAMAQYSGNEVGAIGYDMIPVLSGHLRPTPDGPAFAQYLSAVKHLDRIGCISGSATQEFKGFGEMLVAQGLTGPDVVEVELADEVGGEVATSWSEPERPVVLINGRREPHKNVHACVQAAQRLWEEGLDFELVTLGDVGWSESALSSTTSRLLREGRPLVQLGWVSDEEMWRRIREASFVVFASLHEGYGLPVAEALALGTPVVTTGYGSQREIADRGGCLVVDPRDEASIAEAMRVLITDPVRLANLRDEVRRRPVRTWDAYAGDLWKFLVSSKGSAS